MGARRLFDVGGAVFILHDGWSQKMYMKALIILVSACCWHAAIEYRLLNRILIA